MSEPQFIDGDPVSDDVCDEDEYDIGAAADDAYDSWAGK